MLSRPRTEQFSEEELIREIVSMIEAHETRTGALVEYSSLKQLFYSFFLCNNVELFDTLMLKYETFFEFFENKRFIRVMKVCNVV